MGYAHGGLQVTNPTDSVAGCADAARAAFPKPSTPEDIKTTIQQDYGRNVAIAQRFKIKTVD
jgi:hypothetical protein